MTQTVDVYDYATGQRLGSAVMSYDRWEDYATGRLLEVQWPEGIARADALLSGADLHRLDIAPDTTIYLED